MPQRGGKAKILIDSGCLILEGIRICLKKNCGVVRVVIPILRRSYSGTKNENAKCKVVLQFVNAKLVNLTGRTIGFNGRHIEVVDHSGMMRENVVSLSWI